jgi:hypothetical protein
MGAVQYAVGHCVFEIESAESALSQIEMGLFTQPTLRANIEAVANAQHAHHRLSVDGWSACVAVERREMCAQFIEIEVAIDAAQQVIARNVIVDIEGVEESVLAATLLTHHRDVLPSIGCHQQRSSDQTFQGVFQQNRPIAAAWVGNADDRFAFSAGHQFLFDDP